MLTIVFTASSFAHYMFSRLPQYPIVDNQIKLPRRLEMLFMIQAFVLSCTWIYLIANELVALLQILGLSIGLSKNLMGVTVLAWGNSIGDMVANTLLAKNGNPRMASAGCLGAPFFNCLMGLGMGLTARTIKSYPEPFVFEMTTSTIMSCFFLLGSLVITLFSVVLHGFRFTRRHAYLLVGLYSASLLVSILLESGAIPKFTI